MSSAGPWRTPSTSGMWASFALARAHDSESEIGGLRTSHGHHSMFAVQVPVFAMMAVEAFIHEYPFLRHPSTADAAPMRNYQQALRKPVAALLPHLAAAWWSASLPEGVVSNPSLLAEVRNDLTHPRDRIGNGTRAGLQARGMLPTGDGGLPLATGDGYLFAWWPLARWCWDAAADAVRAFISVDPDGAHPRPFYASIFWPYPGWDIGAGGYPERVEGPALPAPAGG